MNRPLGRLFAALAYRLGLNPNQVTAVSALFTFAGIALIAVAPVEPWTGFVVAVLLVLGYAWDSADGQVARLRGGGSPAGEWLDHVVDSAKILSLHAAVLIGLFRIHVFDAVWLLVPVIFGVAAGTTFMATLLNDLVRIRAGAAVAAQRGGSSAVRSLLVLPLDYGVLCLTFCAYGWPAVFLPVYTVLAALALVFLLLALPRWFRDMNGLHARPPAR